MVSERAKLGGLTRREPPAAGLRPTVLFALALPLTVAHVAFAVWVSQPWRRQLEESIGPVMSWAIPVTLAYIPGLVVGFLIFTLLLTRYHLPELYAPSGPWPEGEWPGVTVLVAAWNEEEVIGLTLRGIASLTYPGPLEVVLADNNSTDRTAEIAGEAAEQLGLPYRRVFEPEPGKYRALNAALATVETPLVVTVDADTYLQRDALTYLIARVTSRPQDQHICACAGGSSP